MAFLKIIKASAGSGKTFKLVQNYLLLLMGSPPAYFQHVLAVTFTNKATSEMKMRVLHELNLLATGKPSSYEKTIAGQYKLDKNTLQQKAHKILNHILHGYGKFQISTIDTFFQQIIRAFSREMNILGGYTLELDIKKVMEQAIDNFIVGIEQGDEVNRWVMQFVFDKIDEGKSWVFKNELELIAMEMGKEQLLSNKDLLQEAYANIVPYLQMVEGQIKTATQKTKEKGQEGLEILAKANLGVDDLFQKSSGPGGVFQKMVNNGMVPEYKSYVKKALDDPYNWTTKKAPQRDLIAGLAEKHLNPILHEAHKLASDFNTAFAIKQNLFALGLIARIQKEFDAICYQKNLFPINYSNPFIFNIIDKNDSPFIYEKIGNRVNHFYIDEFQDTSQLQWENFKPLVSNCLSDSNNCLVVGDIKQSIYRWRNGNWEIMGNQVQRDFIPEVLNTQTLDTNWRSAAQVVQFNNAFFGTLSKMLDEQTETPGQIPFGNLYEDIVQQLAHKNAAIQGKVECTLMSGADTKNDPDAVWQWMAEKINELLGLNFSPGDMVVLTRTKKEGAMVAEWLIEANEQGLFNGEIQVISNESLHLGSSTYVAIIIHALEFLNDNTNRIALSSCAACYLNMVAKNNQNTITLGTSDLSAEYLLTLCPEGFGGLLKTLSNMPLFETIEQLVKFFNLQAIPEGHAYLDAFMDLVSDYINTETADIGSFLDYWKNEGCLKSISSSESPRAIRIMTIHKSKGLEFPIVFMPFCQWSAIPKNGQMIWVSPTTDPYNTMPLLPVKFSKSLANSDFKEAYQMEMFKTTVDNLNMLYVAFTRAQQAVFSFSTYTKDGFNNVGNWLRYSLETLNSKGVINKAEETYNLGVLLPQDAPGDVAPITTRNKGKFVAVPFGKRKIKQGVPWSESEMLQNQRVKGLFYHSVLERIETLEDIPKTIKKLKRDGVIATSHAEHLQSELNTLFNQNTQAAEWFSGKHQVLNETDILLPGKSVKRPDRIMILGDMATVVDYKTSRYNPAHPEQVQEYRQLLQNMGYARVKGYIWYLGENKIMDVA